MASSSILAKIGLNSAGFKTGLAKCKAAALGFKSAGRYLERWDYRQELRGLICLQETR